MDGSPGDATLLAAIGERDLEAMRALYERHAAWLSVRLTRRCNDRDAVADAVQDTFVAVWQKPRVSAAMAMLPRRGALRFAGVSRLRSRRDVIVSFETVDATPVPAAEEQVLLSVEYGDIGQVLARLSPEMRAVIQAVVLDGLTAKEAARLLHMPVGSVKTRLSRG